MDTITIDNKDFKVQPEIAELLLMVSKERDDLKNKIVEIKLNQV